MRRSRFIPVFAAILAFAGGLSVLCAPERAQAEGGDNLPPIQLNPDFATGGIEGEQSQPNLGFNQDFVVNGIEGTGKAVEAADILSRIEGYLNSIDTIHAHFQQIASDGSYASGLLIVDRPGRMRFEYDAPHPVLMIASGGQLLYYDRELEEATYIPTSQTPIWFLLRDDITFGDPLSVVELKQRGNSYLLSLVEEDDLEQGTVTLQFQAEPLELERWQVIDGQGSIAQITLVDPKFNRDVGDFPFDMNDFDASFPGNNPGSGRGNN